MKEKTKLILGGIWVILITLVAVWQLSLFKNGEHYVAVAVVFVFAWVSGLQLGTWSAWMDEYKERHKKQAKD